MSLILRQVIGYSQGRKAVSATASPLLKKQLEDTQKDLNQILNKWKFGDTPIRSSQEFLNNFEPWINTQLEKQKELKVFLAKKGVGSLEEADTKLTNRDLSEGEELAQLNQELTNLKKELANQEQTFLNTEADYLRQIEDLKNRPKGEDQEDLITERDELARDKRTLEQQVLTLNNQLRNKHQEVSRKDKTIETLKKEASQKELQSQKQLKEKNSLITTLNQEINQLKNKYSKQSKLLDTENLENNKLTRKIESLEEDIQILKRDKESLLNQLGERFGEEIED